MTDAATTLAQEIKAQHRRKDTGTCSRCSGYSNRTNWPCDAVRAAEMLLELARAQKRMHDRWCGISQTSTPQWCECGYLGKRPDAARNATQEKP